MTSVSDQRAPSTFRIDGYLGMLWRTVLTALVSAHVLLLLSACKPAQKAVPPERLASVSARPAPSLPPWIEQIRPEAEAQTLSQIRVRFKNPLIPVQALEDPGTHAKVASFVLKPSLPGHFRFLTPRMVGFQADRALPKATRIGVTLRSGLSDLEGNRLHEDLSWTFATEAVKLSDLPNDNQPTALKPQLQFTSNVELDAASLGQRASLTAEGAAGPTPLRIWLKAEATPAPGDDNSQEKFDASARSFVYLLQPEASLLKNTRYRLLFKAGLLPAHGNLRSEEPYHADIITFANLRFRKIATFGAPDEGGAAGRFIDGGPELRFNNRLIADSIVKNVVILPQTRSSIPIARLSSDEQGIDLNPSVLKPSTDYTVKIGANLKDVFGQTLGGPLTVKVHTGDLAADIWAPEGFNVFPSSNQLQLNISAVNLPGSSFKAAYRVLQPADLIGVDTAGPGIGASLLPPIGQWPSYRAGAGKNRTTEITVPVRDKLGGQTGLLAYGVSAKTYWYRPPEGQSLQRTSSFYGLLQLTDVGVFVQWFPDSGLVLVQSISDGSPLPNARVEVYLPGSQTNPQPRTLPCAAGTTRDDGLLLLDGNALRGCMLGRSVFEEPPEFIVVARHARDWAYARTSEYSGAYGYGLVAGWGTSTPESRGLLFSDRQLYQPGETSALTCAAFYFQNGRLHRDAHTRYRLTLEGPTGQNTDLGSHISNDYGTFSLRIHFKADQPLGYYTIRARARNGLEIFGDLRVAEFKPPNFSVKLKLDRELAIGGSRVQADASSNYLFGSPVQGGKATIYVTRGQASFTPKGWDEFSFGRQWFWPEEAPSIPSDVLQNTSVLDPNGEAHQAIDVDGSLPYPMAYRVDFQTVDVSNLSVSDSKTFTALPSDKLIGLQNDWVADTGQPFNVRVIVTDHNGAALDGQRVRVRLELMKYNSVAQLIQGGETSQNSVEYRMIMQRDVVSGTAPQSISLTAPQAGSYRLRANFADAQGEAAATDSQIWVSGDNSVDWVGEERDRLTLKLDKDKYRPGDTASVLIQSPFRDATLFLAVVKQKLIFRKTMRLRGGAPRITFKITADMIPNAALEAVLVRRGRPLAQTEPGSVKSLARIGFAPFSTDVQGQYLRVTISPAHARLTPGSRQAMHFSVRDARGRPARAQLSVMVVNDAILQLSGYREPDLIKTVFADQPIFTRFADNRANVVLKQLVSPLQKGWGYGGGFLPGAANTRVRKNFQPLAYYNAALATDGSGEARAAFALPDDLTTWRIMVVAVAAPLSASDQDGLQGLRFGNADTTFITTKPLIANPALPMFARPGDRFEPGIAVTNPLGLGGTISLTSELFGPLRYDTSPSARNQSLTAKAQAGTQAYRFRVLATSAGTSLLRFSAAIGGVRDAFEVPLPIREADVTEEVATAGALRGQLTSIPVNAAEDVKRNGGGIDIDLSNTVIGGLGAAVKFVLNSDEGEPLLEPLASRLQTIAALRTLALRIPSMRPDARTSAQVRPDLMHLKQLQLADGGFGWWAGSKHSDPFVTPYAAQSLAATAAAGYPVDAAMRNGVRVYLRKLLTNPGQYEYCREASCKNQLRLSALLALADLGESRSDFVGDLYKAHAQFDLAGQFRLGLLLSHLPSWKQQAAALAQRLEESAVYETSRGANINAPEAWRWYDSSVAAQAAALRLFVAMHSNSELLDRVVQSLLALRHNGTWCCNYDNAMALTALAEYSALEKGPRAFTVSVELGSRHVLSTHFDAGQSARRQYRVPMAALVHAPSPLVIRKSGDGTLHYVVAYRYRPTVDQPGSMSGLRITREIRPANAASLLASMGLTAPKDPLSFSAGQVLDVGLEIITDHSVDHVLITDPLPAGLEAVDSAFITSTPYFQPHDSWQIDYQQIHRDRIVAYAQRLDAGVYTFHYVARSVTPGTYLWPGSEAHLLYAPEEFGRAAFSTLKITQ